MSSRVEIIEAGMAAFWASVESEGCDQVAKLVTEDAKSRAPEMTGHLVSLIKLTGNAHSGYTVHSDADYAEYVERGTEDMEAQPYLRPSIHVNYTITQ